jgi:DNA-binding MarR family transcriptional regulator
MKELIKAIGISPNALSMNLLRMLRAGEVDKKVIPFRTTRGSARQYSYRLK